MSQRQLTDYETDASALSRQVSAFQSRAREAAANLYSDMEFTGGGNNA